MINSIAKFFYIAFGALLFAATPASAEIKDWTLAFTGLDSDFNAIVLDYKIGTGRSSFDVNVLTKGCIEPVTDITVGISTNTTAAVNEVQDLKVSLDLEDKSNMVGSQIWNNDSKSVEMCVRVDLLSESDIVIKRNERDIDFIIDYRVDFNLDNVTLAQMIPQEDSIVQLVSVINITLTGFGQIPAEAEEVKAETAEIATVEDDTDTFASVVEAFKAAVEDLLQGAGIDADVEVTATQDTQTGDLDITVEITFSAFCDGSIVCFNTVQELFETFEFDFTQSIEDGSFETSVREEAATDGVDLTSTSITGTDISEPEPQLVVVEFIELYKVTATVGDYIEACTCYSANNFDCNTNLLGPNDYLNVCMKSVDAEMEIDGLGNITVTQGGSEFVIVKDGDLQDSSISSKTKVTRENGMHVASVIPANFFSYDRNNIAEVSGVVYLKLFNSRRRLAVELTANSEVDSGAGSGSTRALATSLGDTETDFAISVVLAKNEAEAVLLGDNDANAATSTSASPGTNVMMTGIIVASTASAVAIMIYFFVKNSRGRGLAKNSSFV